jgi:hypothetical protein
MAGRERPRPRSTMDPGYCGSARFPLNAGQAGTRVAACTPDFCQSPSCSACRLSGRDKSEETRFRRPLRVTPHRRRRHRAVRLSRPRLIRRRRKAIPRRRCRWRSEQRRSARRGRSSRRPLLPLLAPEQRGAIAQGGARYRGDFFRFEIVRPDRTLSTTFRGKQIKGCAPATSKRPTTVTGGPPPIIWEPSRCSQSYSPSLR